MLFLKEYTELEEKLGDFFYKKLDQSKKYKIDVDNDMYFKNNQWYIVSQGYLTNLSFYDNCKIANKLIQTKQVMI